MIRAKDQIDWQRQALWSDNAHSKSALAQAQHALAVEKFQHSELRKAALLRDELILSLRQEAASQRDFCKLTTEHMAQVTRTLTVALSAPDSEEGRLLLSSSYEAQVKENERLRKEISTLSERITHLQQAQRPTTSTPLIAPRPPGQDQTTSNFRPTRATVVTSTRGLSIGQGERRQGDQVDSNGAHEGPQPLLIYPYNAETYETTKDQQGRKPLRRGKGKMRS